MEIRVRSSAADAAEEAAGWLADRLRAAATRRGLATLAVSGGSTPEAMLARLARQDVPWASVEVVQVDERLAPDGSPDRNATGLLARLGGVVPPQRLHLMPVTDPVDGAPAYGRLLRRLAPLDVVHLGLGDDGHTASWPPSGEDGVWRDPWGDAPVAVVRGFRGHDRITLTPVVVNRARSRLVLVTGADKATVVRRWVERDASLPIHMVKPSRTVVVLDADAAGELPAPGGCGAPG